MRKLAYLIGLCLLVCASAFGQEERTTTDVTLSYSYIRANPATRNSTDFNIHGGTAEVALNPRSWSELSAISGAITWTGLIPAWGPICLARESTCRAFVE
jgi:hypothetical protein